MNDTITIVPSEPLGHGSPDFVYVERASRNRSLHVLMQDGVTRSDGTRQNFLAAAYRDAVTRFQTSAYIERAQSYLRRTVRVLDALSIQVETRIDDFRDLGVYVLVEEAHAYHLLCARDGAARVRVKGTFVALNGAAGSQLPPGVEEVPIETTRAQHDLFAQTLPDSLVLFRIEPPADDGALELLLGGGPADVAAALDALDARSGVAQVASERIARSMLYVRFDTSAVGFGARDTTHGSSTRPHAPRRVTRGVVAASLLLGGLVGMGFLATRFDFEGDPGREKAATSSAARATQERPTPVMTREVSEPVEIAAVDPAPAMEEKERFALAWEQTYSEPVTSSPTSFGSAIVFGSRDGKVYAVDRESGDKVWSHAAVGGVGASPVVRGDAVIVADYGGNVYRLARDGGVAWKRALREKIVSTPATTGERVAVGTSRGNVYALSLETGRVLWKFGTRAQVRGGIAYANGTFFVPSHDGRLYALAAETGRKRWSVALGGPVASTPSADAAQVVVGTAQGSIVSFDAKTGARRWSFATKGPVNSAILLTDGRVYAGSGDERVYCLDSGTGKLEWSFETSGAVFSRPFVDGNHVIVTSYDGSVYALDASDGTLVDRYSTEKSIFSSPVVEGDRVYFGNNAGRFFCLSLRDS